MSKPSSPRQIAANRRNALKSTGPRTSEGQAVSRMNAFKHGILSKEVLVRGRVLQESEEELAALHRRFHEALQPEGPIEEMLVDQIVTAQWRLRRALKAEAGEIALSVDGNESRLRREQDLAAQRHDLMWASNPAHSMEQSKAGLGTLKNWLSEVRAAVEAEGDLTEVVVQELAAQFGDNQNSLVSSLRSILKSQPESPAPEEPAAKERRKGAALAFLDKELSRIDLRREELDKEERYKASATRAAAVLPYSGILDKILRYETKLERQIYRAMAQLERVQRMRRGEPVPPPLSVDLNDRA